MKKLIVVLFHVSVLSLISHAQQQQTPQLLKQPANWQFERFPLPPQFAPGIPYKGAEELRFSPGMFNKDSVDYFTYVFVAELENVNSISKDDIQNYLLNYFKGLCWNTAKQRNLSIDTSKVTVAVEKKEGKGDDIFYNASLNIFGVFADGAPVKLNMEIKAINNKAVSKVYLVFITSPRERTDAIWKQLYIIQREFTVP